MRQLNKLFNDICKQNGYCPAVVKSSLRTPDVAILRYKFFQIARPMGYSLRLIGEVAGNRHHSTVLHGLKTLQDLIDTNDPILN